MIVMPDRLHCFECTQEHGVLRAADVVAHGHHVPMRLCWEHVKRRDAPAHPIQYACTDACPVSVSQCGTDDTPRPLVSIVTPTWGRHDLLMEQIDNVRRQTYRPLEHVIVIDGIDDALMRMLQTLNHPLGMVLRNGRAGPSLGSDVPLRFVELGRRWSLELRDSYSAAPMMVAQFLARGEYQMWMSDDERMAPFHVELMARALEVTGVDFVYPRVAYYRWQDPGAAAGIGCSPPIKGAVTTILYRREVIDLAGGPYRTHVGRENDWDFISRAMEGGATHTFVDRVTFTHRDDRDCPPDLYAAPLPEYANA